MANTSASRNSSVTVKVLKDYNGLTATIVETIERKRTRYTGRTRKQNRTARPYSTVSYKGERYSTFVLPACYGEIAGLCISITSSN